MHKLLMLGLLSFTLVRADLIPMLVGTTGVNCAGSPPNTSCDYLYTATIHGGAELTARTDDYPEYFTIYDFHGFEGTVMTPDGWIFRSAATGDTPPGIGIADNPLIPNLTWEYVGGTDLAGGLTISGFMARSVNGPSVVQGMFISQATHETVSPGMTWIRNIGFVDVPNPQAIPGDVPEVPEPMTMGLMGTGLAGLGLMFRLKRR